HRADELHAGAGRVDDRQVQGGLHGAAGTHRALHDRRAHQPHGRGAVGDPDPVGADGRRSHLLHVARARRRAGIGGLMDPDRLPLPLRFVWRTIYWTYERTSLPYDVMVIAILAFVWLTPPDWLGDPMASGSGLLGWILDALQ